LKNLGLDEEDIEEFNESVKSGKKVEELLGLDGDKTIVENPDSAKKKKK
jgi:hypothetical protein